LFVGVQEPRKKIGKKDGETKKEIREGGARLKKWTKESQVEKQGGSGERVRKRAKEKIARWNVKEKWLRKKRKKFGTREREALEVEGEKKGTKKRRQKGGSELEQCPEGLEFGDRGRRKALLVENGRAEKKKGILRKRGERGLWEAGGAEKLQSIRIKERLGESQQRGPRWRGTD